MKRIVVATEQQKQTEALYVDGTLVTCEQIIYAAEIATAADGEPALILNRQVDLPESQEFPKDEAELVDHVD
jgi:sugar/nucleoside kinase (ribokinase family)